MHGLSDHWDMTLQSLTLILIVERSARRVLFCLESRDDFVILPVAKHEDPRAFAEELAAWIRTSGATVLIEEA